jgi:hypothetical protein
MKIWSNSNHSKVWNYDLAKIKKGKALNMNLSFHITTHTKSLTRIWNENQYEFIHFLMLQLNDHSIFFKFQKSIITNGQIIYQNVIWQKCS